MRTLLAFALGIALTLLGVLTVAAQTGASRYQIPLWDIILRQYVFIALGPNFSISQDKVLSVRLPARVIGKELTWDTAVQCWRFPTGVVPSNVAVYVNGMRYKEGRDYVLKNATVVPLQTSNWPPPSSVIVQADWEQ